jgi:hypothetical protein
MNQINATSKQIETIMTELEAKILKIAGLVDVIGCGDGDERREMLHQIAL